MAQSLKSKIRKLSDQFNINAIIDMANEVKSDLQDEQAWNSLFEQQKLKWFYDQCAKYGLTTTQNAHQIKVNELPEVGNHKGTRAYFTAFLPKSVHSEGRHNEFTLEIGSAYTNHPIGNIWETSPGLKGKEKQIAEVIRLHNLGK